MTVEAKAVMIRDAVVDFMMKECGLPMRWLVWLECSSWVVLPTLVCTMSWLSRVKPRSEIS